MGKSSLPAVLKQLVSLQWQLNGNFAIIKTDFGNAIVMTLPIKSQALFTWRIFPPPQSDETGKQTLWLSQFCAQALTGRYPPSAFTLVVNYGSHPSPSLVKTTAFRTMGSLCHLTEKRDAGAGAGVLVQAGQPVAFRKCEQHQPWLVNPLLRVFLHWEPFLKAVEILYSKAILSTLFCKKQWNTAVNVLITMAALSSGEQGLCRLTEIH